MKRRRFSNHPKFYVYCLFDFMGNPRYIGKGCGSRVNLHDKLDGRNPLKDSYVEQAHKVMGEVPKIIIRDNLTEPEAFALEKILIKAIGRYPDGPLCNVTEGGDGISSEDALRFAASFSAEEWRERARKRQAAMTPEQRSEAVRKGWARLTPEQRRARALARDAKMSLEKLAARTERIQAAVRASTKEQRRERTLRGLASWSPEELSERVKKGWAALSPEERSARLRRANASRTPEQKRAAVLKRVNGKTPEERSDAARRSHITRKAKARFTIR